MEKKNIILLVVVAVLLVGVGVGLWLFLDNANNEPIAAPAKEAAPVQEEPFDTEFLKVFAEAVTYRQELGERVSFAMTPADVMMKELDKHPDYADKTFNDEVLKTYAVHYREALLEQYTYWKRGTGQDKNWEGYKETDFAKAITAWLTQVDAVNALVDEYNLPISDELAKEYKLERYFWSAGLYTPTWDDYSNNTDILFEDMEVTSKFEDTGYSTVTLNLKNLTKHKLTGIHVYVYHCTKGGFVLEEEIPIEDWEIDTEVVKEYTVHEKYTDKDHTYDAGSGLPLTLFPNRIIYTN